MHFTVVYCTVLYCTVLQAWRAHWLLRWRETRDVLVPKVAECSTESQITVHATIYYARARPEDPMPLPGAPRLGWDGMGWDT